MIESKYNSIYQQKQKEDDLLNYENLGRELQFIARVVRRGPSKKLQEISEGEMAMLGYLVYEEDETTPTELSSQLDLSTARVANTLNSLEKKGYVERIHDSVDRRKVIVHLTDKGKNTFREKEAQANLEMQEILDMLGEGDAQAFLRIMGRIREFMIQKAHE